MAIILKNIHTNEVVLSDLGISLTLSESREIYTDETNFEFTLSEIQRSIDLYNAIDNSLVVINDGTQDLSKTNSLNVVTGVSLEDIEESVFTENEHENLDTFLHNLDKNSYQEIIRTNNLISDVILWADSGKTEKIRETNITRTNNRISQVIERQYSSGSLVKTKTMTINLSGGLIDNINEVVS